MSRDELQKRNLSFGGVQECVTLLCVGSERGRDTAGAKWRDGGRRQRARATTGSAENRVRQIFAPAHPEPWDRGAAACSCRKCGKKHCDGAHANGRPLARGAASLDRTDERKADLLPRTETPGAPLAFCLEGFHCCRSSPTATGAGGWNPAAASQVALQCWRLLRRRLRSRNTSQFRTDHMVRVGWSHARAHAREMHGPRVCEPRHSGQRWSPSTFTRPPEAGHDESCARHVEMVLWCGQSWSHVAWACSPQPITLRTIQPGSPAPNGTDATKQAA